MLVSITKNSVIHALNTDAIKYCGEIIEINQSGVNFNCDSQQNICNNRMVEYSMRDSVGYEIISQDDSFVRECLVLSKVMQYHLLPYMFHLGFLCHRQNLQSILSIRYLPLPIMCFQMNIKSVHCTRKEK